MSSFIRFYYCSFPTLWLLGLLPNIIRQTDCRILELVLFLFFPQRELRSKNMTNAIKILINLQFSVTKRYKE